MATAAIDLPDDWYDDDLSNNSLGAWTDADGRFFARGADDVVREYGDGPEEAARLARDLRDGSERLPLDPAGRHRPLLATSHWREREAHLPVIGADDFAQYEASPSRILIPAVAAMVFFWLAVGILGAWAAGRL